MIATAESAQQFAPPVPDDASEAVDELLQELERDSLERARAMNAEAIAEHLKPPPRLTVSEWAEEYRMLPETSAAPGPWRNSQTPYLTGIMDAACEPGVEGVVFQKSAQIGGSECLNNVLGFYMHQDPAPILFVQINDKEAEKYSKERIASMIDATPALKSRVAPARSRDSDNTLLSKAFTGGHLGITGANSPAGLRSRPRRVLLMDEIDGYPASAGAEGDPVDLAIRRTTTFWNRLIFLTSTPTLAGTSRIEQAMADCDEIRKFHVPCPHCLHEQELLFQNLRWEKADEEGPDRHRPDTAHMACTACGAVIEEKRKRWMLRNGRWIADEPAERPSWIGFQLSALYSPWMSWAEIAKAFLEAKGNPYKLQVFENTILGNVWEEKGNRLDADPLIQRREEYPDEPLPARVLLLTAGVDVQGDRLEVEILGWGLDEETWSIDYLRIPGDPSGPALWRQLDTALARAFTHPTGLRFRIAATCIDSGYMAQQVYKYAKPRLEQNIWAIKGIAGEGRPIWDRPTNRNKQKVPLWPIGVDTAKNVFYSRLRIEPPEPPGDPTPGFCHFPEREPYDKEYFRQLTSEKVRVRQTRTGYLKREWVRLRGRRAEALDVRVYAMAAYEGLLAGGLRLDTILRQIETGGKAPQPGRRVRHPGVEA